MPKKAQSIFQWNEHQAKCLRLIRIPWRSAYFVIKNLHHRLCQLVRLICKRSVLYSAAVAKFRFSYVDYVAHKLIAFTVDGNADTFLSEYSVCVC